MSPKLLSSALCLILAAGDVAWAGSLKSAPTGAPAVPTLPAISVPALPAAGAAIPGVSQASLPQLRNAALPMSPEAQASGPEQRAEQDRRWDAQEPGKAAAEPVAAEASAGPSALAPSAPGASSAARAIPRPRVGLARAGMLAGWGAATWLSTLAHLGSDRVGPMILGVALGASMSFITMFFAAAMQDQPSGGGRAPEPRPVSEHERAETEALTQALAREAGLPPIAKIQVIDNDLLNAQAGAGENGRGEVRVYGGVLDLPREQREAILRHEISHVRHADGLWSVVHMLLAPVPFSIALAAGMISDPRALLAAPFAVGGLLAWGAIKKVDELHADQYAAATQGTARPLAAALRDMARREAQERWEARQRARSAWDRLLLRAEDRWERVAWVWRSHPSFDRRVRRLERLERGLKEDASR